MRPCERCRGSPHGKELASGPYARRASCLGQFLFRVHARRRMRPETEAGESGSFPDKEAGRMTNKAPPVPRDNQSRKGTGSADKPQDDKPDKEPANPNEQGRQGNVGQNTRNQGYRQAVEGHERASPCICWQRKTSRP